MMKSLNLDVKIKNRLRVQMAEVGCKSLRVLSEETGISTTTLHLMEKNEIQKFGLANVFRLLHFFDCKFEDLFEAEVTSDEPNHFDDLSPELQQQALKYGARLTSEKIAG